LFKRLGLARKPPLSIGAFRERVIGDLLERRPDLQLERVDDAEIRVEGGGETNVARGYAYYREHPQELDLVVRQVADLVLAEIEPAKPDDLIILVRPDSFRTGQNGNDDCGPARPLAAGLVAIVAVDAPARYVFTPVAKLRAELGMDDDAIWDRAMANLRLRLDSRPPKFRPGYLTGLKTDIGLAASLLILDDYWAHPSFAELGDLVVAPVERDEIVVAPLKDATAVQALRNLVARRDSSQFLCDQLLLRRDGAWSEFE